MQSCPHSTPVCDEDAERKIVKNQITKDKAAEAVRRWWHNRLMARDLKKEGRIIECRLNYVPYWKIRAKTDGYVDGEVDHSGESYTLIKREKKVVNGSMTWTKIASDAGDIGIDYLKRPEMETLPEDMSLNPLLAVTVSRKEALDMCCIDIEKVIVESMQMVEVILKQVNVLPVSDAIIFYPLWIAKYTYAGYTYRATVDGVTGDILAGLAPGDPLLRKISHVAAILSSIFIVILIVWSMLYREDACCPVMIISGICFVIAINASHYHNYGSEIRRGISRDTYGPPGYEEQQNHNVTINELKVKVISSIRI
jgi:hypothetical protein